MQNRIVFFHLSLNAGEKAFIYCKSLRYLFFPRFSQCVQGLVHDRETGAECSFQHAVHSHSGDHADGATGPRVLPRFHIDKNRQHSSSVSSLTGKVAATDPGFPRGGGANYKNGSANLLVLPISFKKLHGNKKKLDPQEG